MFSNHWSAERHKEWLAQEAQYSFFAEINLTPLVQKIQLLTQKIQFDYLPILSLEHMHLTLMSIVSTNNAHKDSLYAICGEVQEVVSNFLPATLTLGEPSAWDEGIVIPLRDNPALKELRALLYKISLEHVSEKNLLAGPNFHPHLTLSYSDRAGPKKPVQAILKPFQGKSFGRLEILGVDLVNLRRAEKKYAYSISKRIKP